MEKVRLTGSTAVEAEVIDRYTEKDNGNVYAIALIEGQRVPVVQYPESTLWYCDVGEIVR